MTRGRLWERSHNTTPDAAMPNDDILRPEEGLCKGKGRTVMFGPKNKSFKQNQGVALFEVKTRRMQEKESFVLFIYYLSLKMYFFSYHKAEI